MKQATYSIVTIIFFIVIVIAVVISFFYISSLATIPGGFESKEYQDFVLAKDFKKKLLYCHGKSVLIKELMNTTCANTDKVRGYSVEQIEDISCEKQIWYSGNISSYNNVFIFITNIRSQNSSINCLARLKIYI